MNLLLSFKLTFDWSDKITSKFPSCTWKDVTSWKVPWDKGMVLLRKVFENSITLSPLKGL